MTNKLENRISSREVAEMMDIRHGDLLKKIDGIILLNAKFRSVNIGLNHHM